LPPCGGRGGPARAALTTATTAAEVTRAILRRARRPVTPGKLRWGPPAIHTIVAKVCRKKKPCPAGKKNLRVYSTTPFITSPNVRGKQFDSVAIRGSHGYILEDYIHALYPYPLRLRARDACTKCIMRKGGEDISIRFERNCKIISDLYPRYESQDTGVYIRL